jgi:hypothetical protein
MEMERDCRLAFLHIYIYERTDGSLDHTIGRPTPFCALPQATTSTHSIGGLIWRARAVCKHSNRESNQALPSEDPLSPSCPVPGQPLIALTGCCLDTTSNHLASCRGNFPPFLQPIKDGPGLKALGECSDKPLDTRVKKHQQ